MIIDISRALLERNKRVVMRLADLFEKVHPFLHKMKMTAFYDNHFI